MGRVVADLKEGGGEGEERERDAMGEEEREIETPLVSFHFNHSLLISRPKAKCW